MNPVRQPYHENYYAMYSSWGGGITVEPLEMVVPIDDHMVHRGDGVFETFKCVGGNIYNLDAHLDRLEGSSHSLALPLPATRVRIVELIVETVRAGGHRDCAIRLWVARGPGSFGVDPYECPAAQLYIVCSRLGAPFMDSHPEGATMRVSRVPQKSARFAEIKSCNYLTNVLMKREAVDSGVDFVAGFTEEGFLGEGATENIGIVTGEGELLFPREGGILAGTTMRRVYALAAALVERGIVSRVGVADITIERLRSAAEILVVGTTLNVVAVREFEGQPVGAECPGPVQQCLSAMLKEDILKNRDVQTPVFPPQTCA